MANILASSLGNYISVPNAYTADKPYVVFTVGNPNEVRITVTNADSEDGYNRVISGSPTASLSATSFRTMSGVVALNLLECIKLNPIFYNITLSSANSIKAYIDTSVRYSITVSGSGVSVGGTYSSYNAESMPKVTLMLGCTLNGETVNIPMEKYSDEQTVRFDVTAPFDRMRFRYPISVNVAAYTFHDSAASTVSVPYSNYVVLPTTLKRFEGVDYSLYYNTSSERKRFLTTLDNRPYNYGERYGVSFLSDFADITLKKSFYTNGGVFLESQTTVELHERNGLRHDFYDIIDLDAIEGRHNKQVGYINVTAMRGNSEMSYPLRLSVTPRCSENHEVFFINKLGGIDSFNFNDKVESNVRIGDVTTFNRNPINGYRDDMMTIEGISVKTSDESLTVTKKSLSKDVVEWLGELTRSKVVFRFASSLSPKFKEIIVERSDMSYSSDETEFDVSITYHSSDGKIAY